MEKLLTNVKNGVSFFKVNTNVPFKIKWFNYIIKRNLPWYYRIVPIIVEYEKLNEEEEEKVMSILAENFALVICEKYINRKYVVYTIVTNKTLKEIDTIIEGTGIKALY